MVLSVPAAFRLAVPRRGPLGSSFVPILHPARPRGGGDVVWVQSVLSFRANRRDLGSVSSGGSSIVPKLHENHWDPCSLRPNDEVAEAPGRLGASFVPKQRRRLFRNRRTTPLVRRWWVLGPVWCVVVGAEGLVDEVLSTRRGAADATDPPEMGHRGPTRELMGLTGGGRLAAARAEPVPTAAPWSRPSGTRRSRTPARAPRSGRSAATVLDGGSRSATRGHHSPGSQAKPRPP